MVRHMYFSCSKLSDVCTTKSTNENKYAVRYLVISMNQSDLNIFYCILYYDVIGTSYKNFYKILSVPNTSKT